MTNAITKDMRKTMEHNCSACADHQPDWSDCANDHCPMREYRQYVCPTSGRKWNDDESS